MGFRSTRLTWLVRRLSRMYWQEVPYRVGTVLRSVAQSRGLLDARRVPATASDAAWGKPWCRVPADRAGAAEVREAASAILAGRLQVFGRDVPMRDGIPDWNVDPVTGQRIPASFGLYLDFRHVGPGIDIKFLWEVNRHLWWLPLAQHYALTGDARCLQRLRALLASWLDACPYAYGANWCSPVEHGVRLINWSAVWHLVGGAASPMFEGDDGQRLLRRWLDSIYQHIRFASDNYSLYSSADNHLIGEAAGVYVAAATWDCWTPVRALRREAKAILEREALRQFGPDGVNHEQAVWYQKFALQFLLSSALCARANGDDFSAAFMQRIEAGAVFMAALMDCAGRMPAYGDSDDSEVWRFGHGSGFESYRSFLAAAARLFSRADLQAKVNSVGADGDAQAAWLVDAAAPAADASRPPALPASFVRGGYVLLGEALHTPREFRALFDCGPLGANRVAGHGHADALSLTVSWEGEPLLVDAGTYCYNAAPELRHFFRGTSAHNTLVVDGQDQSEYGASFLWLRDVNCRLIEHVAGAAQSVHAAHDGYTRLADPVTHHRRVSLADDGGPLLVEDWLECAQPHEVELLWHAAAGAALHPDGDVAWTLQSARRALRIEIDGAPFESSIVAGRDSPPQGWVSSRFYEKEAAPVLAVRCRLAPKQVLRTRLVRERARAASPENACAASLGEAR
jgi:hypothetical protein